MHFAPSFDVKSKEHENEMLRKHLEEKSNPYQICCSEHSQQKENF